VAAGEEDQPDALISQLGGGAARVCRGGLSRDGIADPYDVEADSRGGLASHLAFGRQQGDVAADETPQRASRAAWRLRLGAERAGERTALVRALEGDGATHAGYGVDDEADLHLDRA